MPQRDSVAIVEAFWREVWQQQNPDAIDKFVHEDFILTTGSNDIRSRERFKESVKGFLSQVRNFEFYIIESFQNFDGSRVASRWRVTGRNNGMMGTEPNGASFEMFGTAIWEIDENGTLLHNWVERNALEVYSAIIGDGGRTVFSAEP